jgi:hypothetical protein
MRLPGQQSIHAFARNDDPPPQPDYRNRQGIPLGKGVRGRSGNAEASGKLGDRDCGTFVWWG